MLVLKSKKKVIYVDVDDTLISWDSVYLPSTGKIQVTDIDGTIFYFKPNTNLIERIKKHKKVGKETIVVWSQSGWQWAEIVVTALGLEDYVDLVISKPDIYYDDLNVKEQGWKWEIPQF